MARGTCQKHVPFMSLITLYCDVGARHYVIMICLQSSRGSGCMRRKVTTFVAPVKNIRSNVNTIEVCLFSSIHVYIISGRLLSIKTVARQSCELGHAHTHLLHGVWSWTLASHLPSFRLTKTVAHFKIDDCFVVGFLMDHLSSFATSF